MQDLLQTGQKEWVEFHLKMDKAQLATAMRKLKQCPLTLLECIVADLLKNKHSPLFTAMYIPGALVYGKILCWRRRRIGLRQIQSFISAWGGQSPNAAFIIATSGFTDEAKKFAADLHISLLDLSQLVKIPPPLLKPSTARRKTQTHNIHFLH